MHFGNWWWWWGGGGGIDEGEEKWWFDGDEDKMMTWWRWLWWRWLWWRWWCSWWGWWWREEGDADGDDDRDDREHQQCWKSQVFQSFVTFSSKIWTVHKTTLAVVRLATWQQLHLFLWEPGDIGTFWALFLQAFHQCVYLFQTCYQRPDFRIKDSGPSGRQTAEQFITNAPCFANVFPASQQSISLKHTRLCSKPSSM